MRVEELELKVTQKFPPEIKKEIIKDIKIFIEQAIKLKFIIEVE